MIESFRIQNYKALRDVTLDLTPIHVLIGPNDSGKTSILEALAAHCQSVNIGGGTTYTSAYPGRWSGRDLLHRRGRDAKVKSELIFHEQGNHLGHLIEVCFSDNDRQAILAKLQIRDIDQEAQIAIFERDNSQSRLDLVIREPVMEIAASALGKWKKLRWRADHIGLPVLYEDENRFALAESGFGLAMLLNDIKMYDEDRYRAIQSRLCEFFPTIRYIRLMREPVRPDPNDSESLGRGVAIYFELADKVLIPATQISDGILMTLAYLALLHSPEPPRVLLIEEPENGIHPQRLKEIILMLRELVGDGSRTQVLLTTHSPYLVDEFKPEEVTVCLKGNDGSVTAHRLSESEVVRKDMDIFSLGAIWTADGDEKLSIKEVPEEVAVP